MKEGRFEDLQIDAVFLSPPWGGPDYLYQEVFDLEEMYPYSLYVFDFLPFFVFCLSYV